MTRANTDHPASGGAHKDDLESGMPSDARSAGAGTANAGTGVTPASSPNHLERGDFPEPGDETSGGGGHNHRSLPPPSSESAGGRGVTNAKGVAGGGRGASGKFSGTMGAGEKEPKCK